MLVIDLEDNIFEVENLTDTEGKYVGNLFIHQHTVNKEDIGGLRSLSGNRAIRLTPVMVAVAVERNRGIVENANSLTVLLNSLILD